MYTNTILKKYLILLILFCINLNVVDAASFPAKGNKIATDNKRPLTGIEDILRSANPTTMQTIIQNHDTIAAYAFHNALGSQIAAYLEDVYGENFSNELEIMPEAMVLLGIFRWGVEHNIGPVNVPAFAPDDDKHLACFLAAFGSLTLVGEITSLYNAFKSGAPAKTVLRSVKAILARAYGVFTIIATTYGLGSCLGWW